MKSEGRLYLPLVLSLGATLFAAALALGLLTIAAVLGPFRLLAPGSTPAGGTLGLWLRDPAAQGPAAGRVHAWRAVAEERGVSEATTLAALVEGDVRVVALPDARTLSRGEADALASFVRAGGAVLLTGSVGVRGADGSWRGYELMQELLQVSRVVPRPVEATSVVAAAQRGPLSAALEPGERIALVPEPGQPGIDAADAELAWAEGGEPSGASRRLALGRGRLAWLAAGPESAAATGSLGGSAAPGLDRVVRATLAWCAREPFVEMLAWPGGAPFPASLPRESELKTAPGRVAADAAERTAQRRVEEGIERSLATGVPFELPPAPDSLAPRARAALLGHARARLHARGAWFADASAVSAWRRLRDGVAATVERAGPQRSLVEVANHNRDRVAGAVVRVHLNERVARVVVERTTLQQDPVRAQVDRARGQVDVRLPELPAGGRFSFTVDVERIEEERARAGEGRT